MNTALLFIFGLIVGSFLNVVSLRYDPEKSVFNFKNLLGRSHCPYCGKTLRWYELVPVLSFLIQRGRCRSCSVKLSWQYPLVELTSGFIFLLPVYLYNPFAFRFSLFASLVWILVFLTFLLIWTIDYRLYLIPDELNFGLVLLAAVLILTTASQGTFGIFQGSFLGNYAALFGLRQNIWLNHLFGAVFGGLLTGVIIFLTRGKGMGMGDLKLIAALGFLFGWPDILFIFMLGSLVGGVVSLFLIAWSKVMNPPHTRMWGMKSQVPFGPFLIIGAILVFFFGEFLLRNYFIFFL